MIRGLADRLVVAWCWISGSHFIEPWFWWVTSSNPLPPEERGHHGCESCTWCADCSRLLGRGVVPDPRS